jgi:hypothetical protein
MMTISWVSSPRLSKITGAAGFGAGLGSAVGAFTFIARLVAFSDMLIPNKKRGLM